MPTTNNAINQNASQIFEIKKEVENKENAIEKLRQKINDIKNVKNINTDDEYLLRWLYSTDFNIETSFIRMRDYHIDLVLHPNWYARDSPLKYKSFFDANAATMIPACDKEGRPIFISKLGNLNPDTMTFADESVIDEIWYEYILHGHPEIAEKGICMILDFQGVSWKYVKMLNYTDVKLSFKKISCLPFKEFKLHVVNNNRYMKLLLNIVKPFIPEESKKQIHFHLDNLKSLYDHIDRDYLPSEYGGYYKINYKEINKNVFDKSDVIIKNFELYKNVTKVD